MRFSKRLNFCLNVIKPKLKFNPPAAWNFESALCSSAFNEALCRKQHCHNCRRSFTNDFGASKRAMIRFCFRGGKNLNVAPDTCWMVEQQRRKTCTYSMH